MHKIKDLPSKRSEAIKQGIGTYFTGLPCIHGHYAIRRTASGSCSACIAADKKKVLEEFKEFRKAKKLDLRSRVKRAYGAYKANVSD